MRMRAPCERASDGDICSHADHLSNFDSSESGGKSARAGENVFLRGEKGCPSSPLLPPGGRAGKAIGQLGFLRRLRLGLARGLGDFTIEILVIGEAGQL